MNTEAIDMVQPWDRLPEENDLWYGRFESYRLSGPQRSIRSTYTAERRQRAPEGDGQQQGTYSIPASWSEAAQTYRWAERASAWDNYQLDIVRAEQEKMWEELRLQNKQDRVALLQAQQAFVAQQLRAYARETQQDRDLILVKPSELFRGISQVTSDLREELDQKPANRHELSGPNGASIATGITADAVIAAAQRLAQWEAEQFAERGTTDEEEGKDDTE
jgi:hypothetical protein